MKTDPLKYAAHQALERMKQNPPRDITAELADIQRRNRQDATIAIFTCLVLVLAGSGVAVFFGG